MIVALAISSVCSPARAGTIVTASFSGTVSSGGDAFGLLGGGDLTGAPFAVIYEFDPTDFNYGVEHDYSDYYNAFYFQQSPLPLAHVSVTINGVTLADEVPVNVSEGEFSDLHFGVPNGYDSYDVVTQALFAPSPDPSVIDSLQELQVTVTAASNSVDFLPDYTNPTPPNFSLTNLVSSGLVTPVPEFVLEDSRGSYETLYASVDSAVVSGASMADSPEPSSLTCVLLGLLGLAAATPMCRSATTHCYPDKPFR
jgi:hypothetical protein